MPNKSLIQAIILGLGALGAGSAAWLLRATRRPTQRRPQRKGVDRKRLTRLRAVAAATPCK
eukprot:scaffold194196_cov26-Tisochrysis_lutea.AAC.1